MRRPLLLLLLAAACAGDSSEFAEVTPPPRAGLVPEGTSIVLITIDTLRRDHLGCYGYPRDTTPAIDALASRSVVFDSAVAPMATTYPSHLSMLTGVHPHQHGRTSNKLGVERPFASSAEEGGVVSLAHALRAEGYTTAAFVSSIVLHERTGIGDGFDHFYCPPYERNPADAEATTNHALRWLEQNEDRGALFLWVHYWDTHEPNTPRAGYAERAAEDGPVDGWIAQRGIDAGAVTRRLAESKERWQRFLGDAPRAEGGGERSAELLAGLFDRYDGDLAFLDEHLGVLLAHLEVSGLAARSITAFTADHGQSLGENDAIGHGQITDVNTLVPWILRFPAGVLPQPARVNAVVSLVDLAPTVLGRFPPDFLAGFRAQLAGEDVLSGDFSRAYALTQEATNFHGRERSSFRGALVTKRWKLVHDVESGDVLSERLGAEEGADVTSAHREVAETLRRLTAEELRRGRVVDSGSEIDGETAEDLIENLRALGYAGEE